MASSIQSELVSAQPVPAGSNAVLMGITLVCVDILALTLAVTAGFATWSFVNPEILTAGVSMTRAICFSVVAFAFFGLYPGIGMTAVEHIRRVFYCITFVYLLITASMFLEKSLWFNSRGALILAWGLSLILVPLGRWMSGFFLGNLSWWGVPVIILGAGETARTVAGNIQKNAALGYRPVLCLDDDLSKHGGDCSGIPIMGTLAEAEYFAAMYQTNRAIVAMPGMSRERLVHNLQIWSTIFSNILIVPNLFGVASLWTAPRDIGGVLGLEVRQNLLNPLNRWLKRALDLALSGLGCLIALPIVAVAAAWIKLSGPGPVFYAQEREGKDGKPIRVLKLRTMFPNAERMLDDYLNSHPEARAEWDQFCKLKNDPRILPGVGHLLRKTSLDELPQLWNIVKGEMSLVGPRPFPAYHNERFRPEFRSLRTRVTPGLTGLWQVSARSDGDLEVQASLDSYYIRNWSLWLDLYILVCTARIVLARNGAY